MKLIKLLFMLVWANTVFAQNFQKIDSLTNINQFGLALTETEKVYQDAQKSNNTDFAFKALIYKMLLNEELEESELKSLEWLKTELKTAKEPLKSLLHGFYAQSLWKYYQNHRWQIANRSFLTNDSTLETWALQRFSQEIFTQFRFSLQEKELLQKTPISILFESLQKQEKDTPDSLKLRNNRALRPTLYDLLAHQALDFFANTELEMPTNENFDINQPQFFGQYEDFIKIDFSKYVYSNKANSLHIFQQLMRFHKEKNEDAFLDLELKRYNFLYHHANFSLKKTLYIQKLDELAKKYPKSSIYPEIVFAQAYFYKQNNDKIKAKNLAESVLKYNNSLAQENAKKLIADIESKSIYIKTESILLPNQKNLALISFKNVKKLYFSIYKKIDANDLVVAKLQKLLKNTPLKKWVITLPNDSSDYQDHSTEIALPEMPIGEYTLVGSSSETWNDKASYFYNQLSFSNLAYVNRKNKSGNMEIWVTDRSTGKPKVGVEVSVFNQKYDYKIGRYLFGNPFNLKTDEYGFVEIKGQKDYESYYAKIKDGNDYINTKFFDLYKYNYEHDFGVKTFFFTDRAIYRPSQTIYLKAIVLEKTEKGSKVVPNESIYIELLDQNEQVVAQIEGKTNEYGSLSSSFVAPSSLNGVYTIRSKTHNGTAQLQIEEYKRPKFEVSFLPNTQNFVLKDTIRVKGKAQSYSGAVLDNTEVSYTVFRIQKGIHIRFNEHSETLKTGKTRTNEKGEFEIPFEALPRFEFQNKHFYYDFSVEVSVTDNNGETQSNTQNFSVGYTEVFLKPNFEKNIQIEAFHEKGFRINAQNYALQPIKKNGTFQIIALQSPTRILHERIWEKPDLVSINKADFVKNFPFSPFENENKMENWETKGVVLEGKFESDSLILGKKLEVGAYCLLMETTNKQGNKISNKHYFTIFDENQTQLPYQVAAWINVVRNPVEAGDVAKILVGSAFKNTQILYELERDGEILEKYWVNVSNNQELITIPVSNKLSGGFTVHCSFYKENRFYHLQQDFEVPYLHKKLDVSFESFRSVLQPNQKETWKLRIKDHFGEKAAAEMLLSMYDASLDAFVKHNFNFPIFEYHQKTISWESNDIIGGFRAIKPFSYSHYYTTPKQYDDFDYDYNIEIMLGMVEGRAEDMALFNSSTIPITEQRAAPAPKIVMPEIVEVPDEEEITDKVIVGLENTKKMPVSIRKNLQEMAFFLPHLQTDANGDILVNFEAPQALTRWNILGLAHTTDLKIGQVLEKLTTQKPLMIVPNLPRFLRENDHFYISAKVNNLSEKMQKVQIKLEFLDASTMKNIDSEILRQKNEQVVDIAAKESQSVSFEIRVPEGYENLLCRMTAQSNDFSDGEENALPILSDQILVKESMALWTNGNEEREFRMRNLLDNSSKTLRHQSLSLEACSNPAWYAVQALPYLMEYPYECAEQTFSRFYANALAHHVVKPNVKMQEMYKKWAANPEKSLISDLQKNPELKTLLLTETPWVQDAQNETEQKRRLALLFDTKRMESEQKNSLDKLAKMQKSDGGFAWFDGMPTSVWLTQHIVGGMGHLSKLGIDILQNQNLVGDAVLFLDKKSVEKHENLKKLEKEKQLKINDLQISELEIHYLYARSFFKNLTMNTQQTQAHNYFLEQSKNYWTKFGLYSQALIGLVALRNQDQNTANFIYKSLKDRALHSEEMGMYWKNENAWYWYEAPIEQQALLIEFFAEMQDEKAVEEMKVWLLKQKQTQAWESTKATTEASYALLVSGQDWLDGSQSLSVKMDNEEIAVSEDEKEVGTGYFKKVWQKDELKDIKGKINFQKKGKGIAWGGLHWQYFEKLDKIKKSSQELDIRKEVYLVKNTEIVPISTQNKAKIGDLLKIRLVIRADRDLEYIHVKDMRAAGLEPTMVLSGYSYQNGLGFYQVNKDASMNFFIENLPKGTHILEYELRISQKGIFRMVLRLFRVCMLPNLVATAKANASKSNKNRFFLL